MGLLIKKEVNNTFAKSNKENLPVLLGLASHDWRNIETEVEYAHNLIKRASNSYPDVSYEFCNVDDGFVKVCGQMVKKEKKLNLKLNITKKQKRCSKLNYKCMKEGKFFGPQPFLTIKTKSRKFLHDNLDFISENKWGYAFYENTLKRGS